MNTKNPALLENIAAHGKPYIVYGEGVGHRLGYAENFGECKRMHQQWLKETNHPNHHNYAGLSCEAGYLTAGMAFPTFYID